MLRKLQISCDDLLIGPHILPLSHKNQLCNIGQARFLGFPETTQIFTIVLIKAHHTSAVRICATASRRLRLVQKIDKLMSLKAIKVMKWAETFF